MDLPATAELLGQFSEGAGLDLVRLGTTADADEIRDTALTQPLIVAMGLAVAHHLRVAGGVVIAGHSVGEITAAALAGALDPIAAVGFAARRGAEMAGACALSPTGMSAVLGGNIDEVLAAIDRHGLTSANCNAAGQIVAAGSMQGLAALAADAPAGARVRPLAVAGAFHTHFMSTAEDALRQHASTLGTHDLRYPLMSNADGAFVASGADALRRLVRQVTRPVRWDLCQSTMRDIGVTAFIELSPAGALTGMAKRELPGVDLLAIKSPAELENAQQLLSTAAAARTDSAAAAAGSAMVSAGSRAATNHAAMEN